MWTDWVAVVRDISVIFMALFGGLAGLSVVLVVWLIYRKLKPILETVRTTTVTIQGTTAFLGEQAVTPVIRTVGFINGVRRGMQFLGAILRRGSRS